MDEFGDDPESRPVGEAAEADADVFAKLGMSGDGLPQPSPALPGHPRVGDTDAALALASNENAISFGAPTDAAAPPVAQRRRTRLVVSAAAVVVIVVAATIGLVASNGGDNSVPGAGVAPADFVVSSTQNTFGQHTADVVITGSATANGKDIPLTGTGTANFDTSGFTCDVSITSGTHSFVEHEIAVDNHVYMGVTADGQDASAITGGPHWIDVPLPDQHSSSLGAGSVDPLSQFQLLEKKGATVTPLGTSTVDGTNVSGYSVKISKTEEEQSLQQELQSGALPLSLEPLMQQELQRIGTPTIDAYIDSAKLLRQMSFSTSGGSGGPTVKLVMTFDNFGTPITISAPASNDIVTFSKFAQDLQALGGSAGTNG